MSQRPTLSIGLPVRNGEAYLRQNACVSKSAGVCRRGGADCR